MESKKPENLSPKVFRGRPFFESTHKKATSSLFSHGNNEVKLKGFLNLLLIIIITQNARLVLEYLLKYGLFIKFSLPSSIEDFVENWPLLLSLILMQFIFVNAFFIEKKLIPLLIRNLKHVSNFTSMLLSCLNALLVLLIPFYCIRKSKPEPISATLLLGFSITWFLKLFSFHHVLLDLRNAITKKEVIADIPSRLHLLEYPANVKFQEFFEFLAMPTLCYQLEYPRSEKIVKWCVLRHILEMICCLTLMKVIFEQHMMPILSNTPITSETLARKNRFKVFFLLFERILKLSIPNLYVWLLLFIALFHHWLNFLAEITRFADRQFYLDWWNSSSFGEYWRKWNCPIHNFLSRHIHKPLLRKNIPRALAGQLVFLISALAHEYMVCVPLHISWTGLVFAALLVQLPLIQLTSMEFFRKHPQAGNCCFWMLFCFCGQPLATIVYYNLYGVSRHEVTL